MGGQSTDLKVSEREGKTHIAPVGDLVMGNIGAVQKTYERIRKNLDQSRLVLDLRELDRIDMAGAYLLSQLVNSYPQPLSDELFEGQHPHARQMIAIALDNTNSCPMPPERHQLHDLLIRMGQSMSNTLKDGLATLSFAGRLFHTAWNTLLNPTRLRLASIFSVAEQAGMNALPIVAMLSFFMGAVMAFLSANLLSQQGFAIYTVDLVGFAMLREMAVMVTAIILAGRSNSAFTAQIGSMKMRQEIDAMKVLGIDPFEALVLPRVLACLMMMPLLVFGAMITGLIGGVLVSWAELGISPYLFLTRLHEQVELKHFWVGMSKAPVFAVIISVIGCRQGLLVEGNVESLGKRTTMSVVQALFTVILVDAIFAMVYMELNI